MPRLAAAAVLLSVFGCSSPGEIPSSDLNSARIGSSGDAVGSLEAASQVGSVNETVDDATSERVSAAIEDLKEDEAAVAGEPRLICRFETPLGTHFARRVCRTAAEIEKERENVREWDKEMHGHGKVRME